jgi:three-Cys-motif partner protein
MYREKSEMTDKTLQAPLFGGDWTEQKLEILSKYLVAYNTALKDQRFFQRVYIDAFAGTGYREKRQREISVPGLFEDLQEEAPQKFLKGSAKRSLEVIPAFDRYIFVESNPAHIQELESLREEHQDKAHAICIEQGDANAFVQRYCREQDWRTQRAVLFLDPFATEVEWTTIQAIAHTKAIDLWVLFPLMAVNRLLAKDPNRACRHRLDAIFGTEAWFDAFYGISQHDTLFDSDRTPRKTCNPEAIGTFFIDRLKGIFAGVAPHSRLLLNSKNSPLFQLFFAASNPRGAKVAIPIADYILGKI